MNNETRFCIFSSRASIIRRAVIDQVTGILEWNPEMRILMSISVHPSIRFPLFYRTKTQWSKDDSTGESWGKSGGSDIRAVIVHRVPEIDVKEAGKVIMTITSKDIPFVDHGDNP